MLNKKQKGEQAENQALHFLKAKNFILLERNYRCFCGEIDLIMQDKDDIVFVEVRSRQRADYGLAADSINKKKQKKLIKTAIHYLQKKRCLHKVNSRFDVVTIQLIQGEQQLEWIKHAF